MKPRVTGGAIALLVALGLAPRAAEACGCFAQSNPSQQVVQAGEQIAFVQQDGFVEAHIRIQCQGPAEDFGWLLPLPAEPEFGLGNELLFRILRRNTAPRFLLRPERRGSCDEFDDAPAAPYDGPVDPVARQGTLGAYEFVLLDASDLDAVRGWLEAERFFVPTGEHVLAPYVHPGAHFLALRLRKDSSAGELQPIWVRYPADYPMIPIRLTQVGAVDDMAVTVWLLGEHRAVPRNYHHVVLNPEHLSWSGLEEGYVELVGAAVDEAPDHHAFLTEFSGPYAPIRELLGTRQQRRRQSELAAQDDPLDFLGWLQRNGLMSITEAAPTMRGFLPDPDPAPRPRDAQRWASADLYGVELILQQLHDEQPEAYAAYAAAFEAEPAAQAIWTRVVEPLDRMRGFAAEAQQITRLITMLSPHEMTVDPVFGENPDLPDVDAVQIGVRHIDGCDPDGVSLPDGRRFYDEAWRARREAPRTAPAAWRIERLRESGPPEVLVDNTDRLTPSDPPPSCRCAPTSGQPSLLALAALLLPLGLRRRRRARSEP